jgi:hypothetical protein
VSFLNVDGISIFKKNGEKKDMKKDNLGTRKSNKKTYTHTPLGVLFVFFYLGYFRRG